jgi:hypothetical protein
MRYTLPLTPEQKGILKDTIMEILKQKPDINTNDLTMDAYNQLSRTEVVTHDEQVPKTDTDGNIIEGEFETRTYEETVTTPPAFAVCGLIIEMCMQELANEGQLMAL